MIYAGSLVFFPAKGKRLEGSVGGSSEEVRMSTREPLPGFDDRAPSDRYCDLILTGGVTSSIAYPAAIFALATVYRFNSIGGASSGAGAAALAAAAEYRRRHGSSDGFRIMLERAAAVADEVDGKTRLAWLFQPEEENRRLFDALLPGFAKPSGKLAALVGGVLFAYAKSRIVLAIGIALAIIWLIALVRAAQGDIDWPFAFLIGISATMLSFIVIVAAVFVLVARDVGRMVRHDYGLCSGGRSGDAPFLPFTDWLHGLIQEIAGRKADDRPLTFADLAAAPGSPRETLNDLSPMGAASINLQMFTANVTHGRPYVFPQSEGEDDDLPLYFRSSEMNRLFPPDVVKDMEVDPVTRQSNRYQGNAKPAPARAKPVPASRLHWFWSIVMGKSSVVGSDEEPMYLLPREHLPILVAARMSVSFPVLFSAVPLWILDKRDKQKHVFRRCLFCDGGICSNFPIHLFDSPVPSWPTFGISLHEISTSKEIPTSKEGAAEVPSSSRTQEHEDYYGEVWLPEDHLQLGEDQWNEFETEPEPIERLSGFFSALASTTINWSDATLARLPGVRERVVRVGLRSGIGCLNILMKEKDIRGLADLGRVAALKLLKRYAFPVARPSGELSDGWNEHRWVRLNVLRDSLARSLAGLTWAASQGRHGKPLRDLIRQAIDEPVLKNEPVRKDNDSQLLAAQAAALEGALDALMQAERALNMLTVEQPYKPSPRPVMRVRPPL
jgi:predicted acylesterase/phospholipase RssA